MQWRPSRVILATEVPPGQQPLSGSASRVWHVAWLCLVSGPERSEARLTRGPGAEPRRAPLADAVNLVLATTE